MTDLELKIKIIEIFLELDNEMVYYYRHFEKETGEPRERIKKIMDGLRGCEMVEHIRGLMGDEGVAGSGFALTRRATQSSVREWLVVLKKIQLEEKTE